MLDTQQIERKAKREADVAMLKARYPKFKTVGPDCDHLIAAAKNIRMELAAAFPKVKFAVKSSRYSGGCSIHVRWTDGPTSKQVDAIIGKYKAGSFNGMDDSYTYSDNAWNDAFGDANYVFSHREDSVKAVASAMRTINALYGPYECFADLEAAAEDFSRGRLALWGIMVGHYRSLGDQLRETISNRTWALDQRKAVPAWDAEPAV